MKLKNLLKKAGNLIVLSEGRGDSESMYIYYYQKPATQKHFGCNISLSEMVDHFKDKYKILKFGYYADNTPRQAMLKDDNKKVLIAIYDENKTQCSIAISYDIDNVPQEDIDFISQYIVEEKRNNFIYFISTLYGDLSLERVNIPETEINIENNYNTDFYQFNEDIKKTLLESKSGIHILYGIPGSGKSYYIKYLISTIKKKFIYCPSNLTYQLSNPDFIKLMLRQGSDCILIIEDAEEVLIDRGSERNSAVTNILNISDGIIGSALNTQIIATFNTDFQNIDPAITRKGRLLSIYQFKELEVDKTRNLLNSLGIEVEDVKPMTLADIYNYKSQEYIKKENKIGL